jgi:AAHS family 4-hydroxybenzoate transporter-like MFS transporter
MAATPALSLEALVDGRPVGAFQIRTMALCALILFMDGFDTQPSSFTAEGPCSAADVTHIANPTGISNNAVTLTINLIMFYVRLRVSVPLWFNH